MWIQLLCLMQLEMNKLHFFGWYMTPNVYYFFLILIPFQMILTALSCGLKHINFTFIPVNDLFLITGGLHLLRRTSLHCFRSAHDHWDCHGHRALLPICEDSLVRCFHLFSRLVFLSVRSCSAVGCIFVTGSTFRGLSYVTQQVPWLHMLYASIGAVIYTLVSPHSHEFKERIVTLVFITRLLLNNKRHNGPNTQWWSTLLLK